MKEFAKFKELSGPPLASHPQSLVQIHEEILTLPALTTSFAAPGDWFLGRKFSMGSRVHKIFFSDTSARPMKAGRGTLWVRVNLRHYETRFASVVVPKGLKDSARGFNPGYATVNEPP
jgi:hypothetical protein